MLPIAGLRDQLTALLLALVTAAVNCCVPLMESVALTGETLTDTGGISVMVADADFDPSLTLVAVTVTVCCVA